MGHRGPRWKGKSSVVGTPKTKPLLLFLFFIARGVGLCPSLFTFARPENFKDGARFHRACAARQRRKRHARVCKFAHRGSFAVFYTGDNYSGRGTTFLIV